MDGKQVKGKVLNSFDNQEIVTPIPKNIHVIAVHVTNVIDEAGFKAVSSDGRIVSDSSWKCTSVLTSGWQEIDFDDSMWPEPVMKINGYNCKGFPSSSSAMWLWTEHTFKTLNSMYCRKLLKKI